MFKMSKRGQVSADGLTQKMVAITVFALLAAALVPTVLTSFTNLSSSGIALASLFAVLPILLAVFIFFAIFRSLR